MISLSATVGWNGLKSRHWHPYNIGGQSRDSLRVFSGVRSLPESNANDDFDRGRTGKARPGGWTPSDFAWLSLSVRP